MCLSSIEKFKVNTKFGYKIFVQKNKKLYPEYMGYKEYKVNKWYNEKERREELESNKIVGEDYAAIYINGEIDKDNKYRKGFHIFLTRTDAEKYYTSSDAVIRMVEFNSVVETGYQEKYSGYAVEALKTAVAKNMRILSIKEMNAKESIK
jgi:hypothetical protein